MHEHPNLAMSMSTDIYVYGHTCSVQVHIYTHGTVYEKNKLSLIVYNIGLSDQPTNSSATHLKDVIYIYY